MEAYFSGDEMVHRHGQGIYVRKEIAVEKGYITEEKAAELKGASYVYIPPTKMEVPMWYDALALETLGTNYNRSPLFYFRSTRTGILYVASRARAQRILDKADHGLGLKEDGTPVAVYRGTYTIVKQGQHYSIKLVEN